MIKFILILNGAGGELDRTEIVPSKVSDDLLDPSDYIQALTESQWILADGDSIQVKAVQS